MPQWVKHLKPELAKSWHAERGHEGSGGRPSTSRLLCSPPAPPHGHAHRRARPQHHTASVHSLQVSTGTGTCPHTPPCAETTTCTAALCPFQTWKPRLGPCSWSRSRCEMCSSPPQATWLPPTPPPSLGDSARRGTRTQKCPHCRALAEQGRCARWEDLQQDLVQEHTQVRKRVRASGQLGPPSRPSVPAAHGAEQRALPGALGQGSVGSS